MFRSKKKCQEENEKQDILFKNFKFYFDWYKIIVYSIQKLFYQSSMNISRQFIWPTLTSKMIANILLMPYINPLNQY